MAKGDIPHLVFSKRRPAAPDFMFATGIENSHPTIAGADGQTMRVDEMEKTGHYASKQLISQWREILPIDRVCLMPLIDA